MPQPGTPMSSVATKPAPWPASILISSLLSCYFPPQHSRHRVHGIRRRYIDSWFVWEIVAPLPFTQNWFNILMYLSVRGRSIEKLNYLLLCLKTAASMLYLAMLLSSSSWPTGTPGLSSTSCLTPRSRRAWIQLRWKLNCSPVSTRQ